MIGKRTALAVVFSIALLVAASAQERQLESWTEYHSDKWQFCAAFPKEWRAGEVFGGEVLKASPKGDEATVLSLGAFRNEHGEGERPEKSLEAVAEDSEDDLRDSMVSALQSHNETTKVSGLPALITIRSYMKGRERFRAEEVRVRREDGVVVELILRAPEGQFERTQSAFDAMVQKQFKASCTKVGK